MQAVDIDTTADWLDAIRHFSYSSALKQQRHDQDVNVRGADGNTALHVAAEFGAVGKIHKLLAAGADFRAVNDHGWAPLRVAQSKVRIDVAQCLIEHEHLVRALTKRLGRVPTVNKLRGAMWIQKMRTFRDTVSQQVETHGAQLVQAARDGELHTVRALLETGEIHVDTMDKSTNETAFFAALANGRLRVCEFLLEKGAHTFGPCVVNGRMHSALVTAVLTGDISFVRQLVQCGACLYAPEIDTQACALAEAARLGDIEMIDALIELGVPFHAPNLPWLRLRSPVCCAFEGSHPHELPWWLLYVACWQQDWNWIQHLFATHADLRNHELMATRGANALYVAVALQNEAIVTELLKRGAEINQPIVRGMTAIVAAVRVRSVRMLCFLLERGADPLIQHSQLTRLTGFSESPLSTAVYVGAMECVDVLLALDTRRWIRDQALIHAAKHGDVEYVRLLLDNSSTTSQVLPSTELWFHECVKKIKCPLTLDLILSRCCGDSIGTDTERYSAAALNEIVASLHQSSPDLDLLSVFLAHGVEFDFTIKNS